ncbi:hypothetical protein Hanom_Chr10g00924161 [Helianthus anomalus]
MEGIMMMMIHSAGILLLVAFFMLGFEVSEAVSNDSILAASSRNESHYQGKLLLLH